MPAKIKQQLSLDADGYSNPVTNNDRKNVAGMKPHTAKPRKTAKLPPPTTLQPYLPGLSRRGRPRSINPIPPTVRASESRKRRLESGVKRIELFLEPQVARDLDSLAEHFKVTRVEVISRLVNKAAKRLSPKP